MEQGRGFREYVRDPNPSPGPSPTGYGLERRIHFMPQRVYDRTRGIEERGIEESKQQQQAQSVGVHCQLVGVPATRDYMLPLRIDENERQRQPAQSVSVPAQSVGVPAQSVGVLATGDYMFPQSVGVAAAGDYMLPQSVSVATTRDYMLPQRGYDHTGEEKNGGRHQQQQAPSIGVAATGDYMLPQRGYHHTGGIDEIERRRQQQAQSVAANYMLPQHGYTHTGVEENEHQSVGAAAIGDYMLPHSQLELNQSMAQSAYPYGDPYFGRGIVTAYGAAQATIYPHMLGVQQARMPLPSEEEVQEPVFVNAKQYHGILRRRQTRAKAEAEHKLIKSRKPYLHESRHLHALRRARGCGGRFLNTQAKDEEATSKVGSHKPVSEGHSSTGSEDLGHLQDER